MDALTPQQRFALPTLLLDCDGVMLDYLTPFLAAVRTATGVQYAHDAITEYDVFAQVARETSIAYKDVRTRSLRAWRQLYGPRGPSFKPYPEAVEALVQLRPLANIYVVTAARQNLDQRIRALRPLGIPEAHLICARTAAKALIRGDVFADDLPSTVEAWRARNPAGTGVVFGRRYNAGWGTWADVLAAVNVAREKIVDSAPVVDAPQAHGDSLLVQWRARRVRWTSPSDRHAIARTLGAVATLCPAVAIGPPEARWWCTRRDGTQLHDWVAFADGEYRVPVVVLADLQDGEYVIAEAT